ncbi:MAG: 50S ribosomal protein L13 [Candidatus Gracilibacteria bacterium]|nr:50S ribosomal protein L13 [Candidatus Gracilibacteria bacterium]
MQKTHIPKKQDLAEKWYLVDATDKPLGRLTSEIAKLLNGKRRPDFTPHLLNNDLVIVINAEKVKLTGNKLEAKLYYTHSGYMGGLKAVSAGKKLAKDPTFLIKHAVIGMLPKNKLQNKLMSHLKVYAGAEHPHEAQKPELIELN